MPILINLVHGPLFCRRLYDLMTTSLTHWGQVNIDHGKGLLLVRIQAVTWNWYCHINEIRTQWVEDHSIHCMYIYSWKWFISDCTEYSNKRFWTELNWIESSIQHTSTWSNSLIISIYPATSARRQNFMSPSYKNNIHILILMFV